MCIKLISGKNAKREKKKNLSGKEKEVEENRRKNQDFWEISCIRHHEVQISCIQEERTSELKRRDKE